jgi:cellulose synthase/poly-beta-1,6-N-acetylglucosamine synthase-like glycosyltransferase
MASGNLSILPSDQYAESSQMPTDLANVVWYNSFENLAWQYDSSGTLVGTFSRVPLGTFSHVRAVPLRQQPLGARRTSLSFDLSTRRFMFYSNGFYDSSLDFSFVDL